MLGGARCGEVLSSSYIVYPATLSPALSALFPAVELSIHFDLDLPLVLRARRIAARELAHDRAQGYLQDHWRTDAPVLLRAHTLPLVLPRTCEGTNESLARCGSGKM